ncbi:cadherin-like and PC-esterase domain-containing protein 1 isoform X2 [Brachyhypopomus gauderio]|uniref:cadherin-like and PC-esterase domain-containing protein 1 isoform X2 n=1 Tax=Brachyhypopomus gauderio TaxID=698409 RepID=UPI0040433FBB
MLLRRLWTLRRKCCTGPLLVLGIAVFLFYQTLMVDRNWFRPGQTNKRNKSVMTERNHVLLLKNPEQLITFLEVSRANNEVRRSKSSCVERAIVLTGQYVPSDTEVQLYQRVLQEQGYHVEQSRYAETSTSLKHDQRDGRDWSLLICLKDSEKSCLRKISFAHPQPYQKVNIIPAFVGAFFDMGGTCRFLMDSRLSGLPLPIIPSACAPSRPEQEWNPHHPGDERGPHTQSGQLANQGLVAMVKVYVMVTSVMPLTAFIHHTGLVKTHLEKNSYPAKLLGFFSQMLGPTLSLQASERMKQVINEVLTAALLVTTESQRCRLCFQFLTFTLHYDAFVRPVVVKVQTDLRFDGMKDPNFDGQITKEYLLEDMLKLLFPPCNSEDSSLDETIIKYGGCERRDDLCVSPDESQLLLQFYEQLRGAGSFHAMFPRSSHPSDLQDDLIQRFPSAEHSGKRAGFMDLLEQLSSYYTLRVRTESDGPAGLGLNKLHSEPSDSGQCVEPRLQQIYADPALVLTPPFNPWVKEYHSEVPFDIITIRIRPEPVSKHCRVRLDDHNGPSMANYPVGLGNSRINILVLDESGMEPVVITIYTLHIFRESRPSLPMFDEHVMCGFIQDCGLVVRPDQPCGLEPVPGQRSSVEPQASSRPCPSGDQPGRWVVPCLSCSDNRTCDWREVTWQPDNCYHPLLKQPELQKCMMDRKILFIGDSTNRGMMYYLMERVNTTLEDWDKAHDTIVYHNLNQGRTLISYSYYPQFWMQKSQRPTFQRALQQLIERSRPLENSPQTVLVAGGVQWLNLDHLKTIQQVLERERLQSIVVVVKSLGMGFHLPVDGIHTLSLTGLRKLDSMNKNILEGAKCLGYEVIDTFSLTMGRYKEFLQGRCVCHFHEVGKPSLPTVTAHRQQGQIERAAESVGRNTVGGASVQQTGDRPHPSLSYHVMGAVNQVYSEILLSRVCASDVHNATTHQHQHRPS